MPSPLPGAAQSHVNLEEEKRVFIADTGRPRALALFRLAAPPLPSAGDDAAERTRAGGVPGAAYHPRGMGTSGPSSASQCGSPGCAQPSGSGAAAAVPTPCSELAPGAPAPADGRQPPLRSGLAAPALHGPSACGKRGTRDARPSPSATRVHGYGERPAGKPRARTRAGTHPFTSSVEIKTLADVFMQASGISKCSKIYGLNKVQADRGGAATRWLLPRAVPAGQPGVPARSVHRGWGLRHPQQSTSLIWDTKPLRSPTELTHRNST